MSASANSPRVVAIARFSALGDVAIALPLVYALARSNPDMTIIMVTRPLPARIMVNAPDNLIVLGVDVKNEYAGVMGLRKLARRLSADYHVTDYLDLHAVLRSKVLGMWLKTMGVRVTTLHKDRQGRRRLTRPENKDMRPAMSSADAYADVIARAGFHAESTAFNTLFGGHAKADATLFADHAVKTPGQKWIGIAPFAAHATKIYPTDKMAEVVERLLERPDVHIILFGGGDHETAILQAIADRHPGRVTNMAGARAGLAVEMALMNHLDVMLTMDSANMHLAALCGTPIVAVWGATHPLCGFAPLTDAVTYVQRDLPCRPCSVYGKTPCRRGDMACLNGISPATISDAVLNTLQHPSANVRNL